MPQYLRYSTWLVAVLLATALVEPVLAQVGRIGGVVQDEEGEPIRGATVTAENPDINLTYTATTDDRGRFAFLGLRTGTWRFMADAPGFAPQGGEMPVRADGRLNPALSFALVKAREGAGPLGDVSADELQEALSAADALFQAEQWDEAIAAYRALIDDSPALTVMNLQIGSAYRQKGDFPAAVAAYSELLEVDTSNGLARVGIAMAHLAVGDAAAAEAALLPVAQDADARPDVMYTLGEVKMAQGLATDAAQWYQRAVDADPSWGKPIYRLAEAALGRGDTQAASELLAEIIEVDPISPEAAQAKAELEQLSP